MIQENLVELSDLTLAENGQNSVLLRERALSLLQTVCGDTWSDHNTADPGITLLEVLAFVISDLSYRLDFPIADLLAVNPADDDDDNQQAFYLAPQILPSNSVTLADHRRAIIDIPGIKNASFSTVNNLDSTQHSTSGSLNIRVDLDDHWQDKSPQEKHALYDIVRQKFLSERNVNQDLNAIIPIEKHKVVIGFSLDFTRIDDPLNTVVEVFKRTQNLLSAAVKRYSGDVLKQAGYSGDEIYQGPLLEHGFILEQDVADLVMPSTIYASDIFEALDSMSALKKIMAFSFIPVAGDSLNQGKNYLNWRLKMSADHVPMFDIAASLAQLELSIEGQGYVLSVAEKQTILDSFTPNANQDIDAVGHNDFLTEYISGRYRNLNQYISLQHEFPAVYRLAESRFDGTIGTTEQAGILQLKGYLTLFDQILTDQCAQLDNLRKLLALPQQAVYTRLAQVFACMLASEPLSSVQIAHFWQDVRQLPITQLSQPITNISGVEHLLGDYFSTYQQQGFQPLAEPVLSESQLDRLQRSMAHLLARFAETTLDANLLKYRAVFGHYLQDFEPIPSDISTDNAFIEKLTGLKQIIDLVKIIDHYPQLSKHRAGGGNYLHSHISEYYVSGLAQRIMTFMGFSHIGQIPLATNNRESFYLLEAELLRHGGTEEHFARNELYFVVPNWPTRLAEMHFNHLLNTQIQQSCPVHIIPQVIRVNRQEMSLFERVYYAWLNCLSKQSLVVLPVREPIQASLDTVQISLEQQELVTLLSLYLRHFTYEPTQFMLFLLEEVGGEVGEMSQEDLMVWLLEYSNESLVDAQLNMYLLNQGMPEVIKALKAKLTPEHAILLDDYANSLEADDLASIKQYFCQLIDTNPEAYPNQSGQGSLLNLALSIEINLSLTDQDSLILHHASLRGVIDELRVKLIDNPSHYPGVSVNSYLFSCLIRLSLKIWLAVEHRAEVDGLSLAIIVAQITNLLEVEEPLYSNLTSAELFTALCHQHLERLITPKSISKGEIGQTFRIGYPVLEQLKTNYPINIAKINPYSKHKPELTLAINEPFSI